MQTYRQSGYTMMKMKIGGASLLEEIARIETALDFAETGSNLAVDANGALSLDSAIRYVGAIDGYNLAWFEEPIDPLDFQGHAEISEVANMPLAQGKFVFKIVLLISFAMVAFAGIVTGCNLIRLCYGPSEFIAIVKMGEELGWSPRRHCPHGGQQLGLHLAAETS